ncbi:FAD-binding oxidoreductase [Maliponia aquimaris]|uniref:Putative decaprenylphosphoryl-beta-D-ribose oxidase n=1 Tax=Maliponia aquimaris TaxID=1673631 RepID=A0A238KJ36_9RHOB|nr:FAD-binding oxidoreductase [Maliponia aquimaris]SMX42707.1 putative decaprenylphosphoryl-beta-D-ribose oxidase [Maliponia aquimaris]
MKLSGWGRFPVIETDLRAPRTEDDLRAALGQGALIARGNGRSYGDSAVSPRATLHMRHFNHMLAFDETTGQLVAEAGVLLGDVIDAFLPRGWFPMITPGTRLITLGGAIAADVHGKNHHKDGSFGTCVDWIDVMGPDGAVLRCSREDNADLFRYTLGGMGLTGIILRCAIRLRPVESAWIQQTTHPAPDLDTAMRLFEENQQVTYSVAWIDCLGRGAHLGRSLVMLGEHATVAELDAKRARHPLDAGHKPKLAVPLDFPGFALNSLTVRAFNKLYYTLGARKTGTQLVDWDTYFYPLDAVLKWNRIYGRRGFAQFQCVLPLETSRDGLTALLEAISDSGNASFLAVLKRFGPQDSAMSFPMEGYTLALDFPMKSGTLALLDRLDRITLNHDGRFYLAKDSRMSADTLRAADPRVRAFTEMRKDRNLSGHFASAQSERLSL